MQCGKYGHLKCTSEKQSRIIKIDDKVKNDLNEFVIQNFREAEVSDSEEPDSIKQSMNPEKKDVDAFDYVNPNAISSSKGKKNKN